MTDPSRSSRRIPRGRVGPRSLGRRWCSRRCRRTVRPGFGSDLVGRERTEEGIRFRFRTRAGLAEEIRDLAAREKACCAFFDFDVREHGDEITWDASVVDDPIARQILDEYYALPDTLAGSVADLFDRFAESGLEIVVNDGVMRPATTSDLGIQ